MNENEKEIENVRVVFDTVNQFQMLAPTSVAQGVLALCEDENNTYRQKEIAADMMDLICNSVPRKTTETTTKTGKKTVTEVPAYNPVFTNEMKKEFEAKYKELLVSKAHEKRLGIVKEFFSTYKPTISLADALYRLSFYLIPNKNNLAKSTNNLISFVKKMFLGQANNLLVDAAILIGGQGKSTIQQGLIRAAQEIGFSSSMCHLPTIQDGVQDVFVKNEVCVDDECRFAKMDYDSLNKILDKSTITIKGKYIKEWQAKSIANILVGTNSMPTDVNARRYSIRMVDENFKLNENYGRWDIPGTAGDNFGSSYEQVVDWTTEGWLNLFYYCNKYDIKEQAYKEMSFDYSILYKIQKALKDQSTNVATISEMIKYLESVEGDSFNFPTRQAYRDKLFILATQLKLDIVGDRKRNMYNTYDWTPALEIDEAIPTDPLETIHCYFHNNPDFNIQN